MSYFNKVILLGRLVRGAEYRELSAGKSFCNFTLILSRNGKNSDEPVFVGVTCFGRMAENVSRFTQAGSEVIVEGRLHLDQWRDAEGHSKSKLKVIAENTRFVSGLKKEANREFNTNEN